MPVLLVRNEGPIVLVPARDLMSKLASLDGDKFPRSPYDIERDLNEVNAVGGVPGTLCEPWRDGADWSLLLYTRRYVVRLFRTRRGDAYTIASVAALRLTDHQQLARACLLLHPSGWQVALSFPDIPQGADSGWHLIASGWDNLLKSLAASAPAPGKQETFLDRLDEVIDATKRITAHAENAPGFPYRQVAPTAGARSGAAQLYEFTLAGPHDLDAGTFVQVSPMAASVRGVRSVSRGRVTRAGGTTVTIRFDEPVSWADVQGQGEITLTPSDFAYRQQHAAVSRLRSGHARNPGVLAALAEGRLDPPRGRQETGQPSLPLDERQHEAFSKAAKGPDLLVVIGPPGTGKTRTITEMSRAAAGRGERVLICSQNNRAVDNVLPRLPRALLAIRVGNEVAVTQEGIPYLLQRQAADLRAEALNLARRNMAAYGRLSDADAWATELAHANAGLAGARAALSQAESRYEEACRAVGGPAAREVKRIEAVVTSREKDVERSHAKLERLRHGSAAASFAPLARRRAKRLDAAHGKATALVAALRDAEAELDKAWQHLAEVTKDVPAVASAALTAQAFIRKAEADHSAALEAARAACEIATGMGAEPPPVQVHDFDLECDDAELAAAQSWLHGWLPQMRSRRDLLARWIDEASGESEQLHPELIRYADVLAATCIGAGSRPELADVDVDLAIVDEAGQIGVGNALIPLVRARRAVLVGDHMQLPPFLDSDVREWGDLVGDPVVQDLLAKSALEMVVRELPPGCPNVVWLTEQRRMPAEVAEFVSARFYNGRLITPAGFSRERRDEVFRSAFAFVDTSALEWAKRRDRSGRNRERWGQRGYDNPLEGGLLASLAVHYDRLHRDWAVIVPYQAQAELIRTLLASRLGGTGKIQLNVGTVDSFQGGERDVILYGFTRSNPQGEVGFLRELRRVNVAVTRVREQLVLVGDLETLTSSRDEEFRNLARSLRQHVAQAGEVLPYAVAVSLLEAAR